MREQLAKDYEAMTGIIFGKVPALSDVLVAITQSWRQALNATAAAAPS